MSFDEIEDFEIFGLRFRATHAEQRRMWLQLSKSAQSKEWGITRNLINLVVSRTKTMEVEELAVRLENADKAMTELAYRLIEELEASRG